MFKNLAIFALLYGAEALKVVQKAEEGVEQYTLPVTEETEAVQEEDQGFNSFEEFVQLASKEEASADAQEERIPQTCMSGIERWSDAADSMRTFRRANRGSRKWRDPSFPADEQALFWRNYLTREQLSTARNMIKIRNWRRPSQMTDHPLLWGTKGKPIPNGVNQNGVGDCWFLAAAAAVAEKSSSITNLFTNRHYDRNGIFRVKFWQKGRWHGINVDDRLPVVKKWQKINGRWKKVWKAFADGESRNKAWWMPILEKAYAKFDQTYERIEAGMGMEGIRVLTGAPVTAFQTNRMSQGQLWNLLRMLTKNNDNPMTAGAKRKAYGIITGHAYSVLDTAELKDANGNVAHQIVQVRNPWSHEKWRGPFSDKSSMWTPEWKRQVGMLDQNDGKFWMPMRYFKYIYSSLSVGYDRKFASTQHIKLNERGHTWSYNMHNPVDQEIFITIEGYSSRNYPRTCRLGQRPFTGSVFFMHPNWRMIQRTSSGHFGAQSIGSLKGQIIPKGDYLVYLVNWKWNRGTKMNVDVFVQTSKAKPTLKLGYKRTNGRW